MTYATQQSLTDRFGEAEIEQLSDRDIPPLGMINQAVVTQALTDAANTIDGYLAGRYTLPLNNPPPLLELFCCDIARYRLMTRPTDEARARYQDALNWLGKVAAGTIELGGASQDAPPVAGGPTGISQRRVFDARSLREWNHPRGWGLGGRE